MPMRAAAGLPRNGSGAECAAVLRVPVDGDTFNKGKKQVGTQDVRSKPDSSKMAFKKGIKLFVNACVCSLNAV
jgi:hypothetical protein